MPPGTASQILTRLSAFWESRDSVLLPPCELPVGFGLAAPEVFLRLLDRQESTTHQLVAVHRPADARYGRSSLRLARHLRFQLVQRPARPGVRKLVVESLKATGFEVERRDVRFVEGRTTRPEFGVAGRHQRVLIDGLPVARLVFVESAAGVTLPLSCCEISYGIERLASVQQGHADLFAIQWSRESTVDSDGGISDVSSGAHWMEEERSRYLLEVAEIDTLRVELDASDREAERALGAGLVLPAYERALRCLFLLEVLRLRSLPLLVDHEVLSERVRLRIAGCAKLQAERSGWRYESASEPQSLMDPSAVSASDLFGGGSS